MNGREFSPRAYAVFGPKFVSTRGFFQDRALESRCITEETGGRSLRDDIPINLTAEYQRAALAIRNKLLMSASVTPANGRSMPVSLTGASSPASHRSSYRS